jgi:OmcA/MtrC family decaheme c-type cytochrome
MKFAGARGITRSRVPLIAMLALAATIGLAGCEGDDGKDGLNGTNGTNGTNGATGPAGPTGPAGATGPTGPTGPSAKVEPRESCGVCHDTSSAYAASSAHALDPLQTITTPVFKVNGADLDITYNVKIGGSNATGLTLVRSDYRLAGGGAQSDLGTPDPVVTDLGNGNYSIKVLGGAAYAAVNSRYFFRISDPALTKTVGVWGDYPAAPRTDLVGNQSCNNCHGDAGVAPHTFKPYDYPGMVNSQCVVCHTATGFYASIINESWVGLVHGIHNSEQMPSGHYQFNPTTKFEVSYPTYMVNCSVCHDTPATLAAANAMKVTGPNCLSCHESMESWEFPSGLDFHEGYTEATNCQTCHNDTAGAVAPNKVTAFHNGLETERVGIIWNGEDLSVTEGKKFTWKIDNVVDDGTNLKISWSATYNGAAVDPCNSAIGPGKPLFHNAPAGTVLDGAPQFLRSYAQGDDFILGTSTTAPGQPGTLTLSTTNTTCAGNVATTTWAVDKTVAAGTRGYIALQGKPQLPLPAGFSNPEYTFTNMYVRVPTPDREFVVGTGAKPATERRAIADTADCLKCHVGSLYQHGNTRVDNVKMCGACHNSASTEQNNRLAMGVDKSEAYDGKVGQTYELKTMLHAIHSAGDETHKTFAIYRTRGIYAWTPEGVTPPNWSTTKCEKATPTADIQEYRVFGGDPALDVSCQPHNLYHPTYPREVNDCAACHVAGFTVIPDQSKAVATTLDAGSTTWQNKLDDTLQGASAAACTSCHQSTDAKGHAYQNGWTPQVFPDGRQTILDTK